MGNCCSSRKQKEQLPRPTPGRRRYSMGNTYNTYRTNPILELLEEEYQSNKNLEIKKKGRPRCERYDLDGDLSPRRVEAWESRGKSRHGVRQRAVRGAGRSRAIRSAKSHKKTKTRKRKRMDFIEDDEDDSDSEDSEIETSDDDSDSNSDSDDDSAVDRRKMSKSVKRRRNQQSRRKRPGKREKVINENEDEDEDEYLEEKDDDDGDEEEQDEQRKNDKRKKSQSKQNARENSKKRVKAKTQPRSKVKKLIEDDKIALLGTEDDDNDDDEGDDAEDEDEQEDTSKTQESETKGRAKGKEIEKPNPYRWTNPSPIFDKNKSSIYQRARAKGSDRESIRQLEIQRHRKRRERESSSLQKPKKSVSGDTGDDDWTDTDASSLATSKRSGSTSSRLSSLFGPRNRSLTPETTSHLMSPISPLTRPSISSRRGETTFGATVIRASPLQEIVSADSLPANPEPNDTIITPPPAVHQRALSPMPKAGDPCMEGMKKVIFMSRGKRSSIKLVPSDGKPTDPDDVEIILTK